MEDNVKEAKPATKGRRIKIKRKPPVEAASDAVGTPSEEKSPARKVEEKGKDDAKKVSQSEAPSSEDGGKVVDARMVITLRRNSKRDEETRPRKVSLEEPPDADQKQEDKSVLAIKGKAIKVTAMRSSQHENVDFVDDDVLDLSHPSGLSDPASEQEQVVAKKAAKKKKKKKKRKHKNRRESIEEQESDREMRRESDEMSPEPKRKFVLKNDFYSEDDDFEEEKEQPRSGRRSKRSSTTKRPHDSSRDQSDRRERKRYRRERSESVSDHKDKRSRSRRHDGRIKPERRRKHRRRHRRDDYDTDSSSYDEEPNFRRSRRSVS